MAGSKTESENQDQSSDGEQPWLVAGDGHLAVRVAMYFSGGGLFGGVRIFTGFVCSTPAPVLRLRKLNDDQSHVARVTATRKSVDWAKGIRKYFR